MTSPIGSIPFHAVQAYQRLGQTQRAHPIQQAQPPQPAAPTRAPDRVDPRLIAGQVQGGIDFATDGTPRPTDPGALPMYRHPADRNIAATSVTAGKMIDVSG